MNINAHGLVIRPGDSLLIAFEGRQSDADIDELLREIRERLPGIAQIAVFENVTAMAVYRPDETDPT